MDYISTKETTKKWDISEWRLQKLCEDNRILNAVGFFRVWAIPKRRGKYGQQTEESTQNR